MRGARRAGLAVAVLAAATLRAQRPPPDELVALEPVLRAAVAAVAPSVVTVETFGGVRKLLGDDPAAPGDGPRPDRPAPPPEQPKPGEGEPAPEPKEEEEKPGPLVQRGFLQALGATTGVVLSADGWIAVSRFALNFDPTTILVTAADGRSFTARRAGEDTSRGLALLKVDATDLPVPRFRDPATVRVGQWAFALGRTFGRSEPSVHMGIVSATGRLFGRALQTDAYTSPANYGGPLVDVDGNVLGIVVPLSRSGRDAGAELYDSGIGFAATVADIAPLLERMKRGDVLHRAWLGVSTVAAHFGPGALLDAVADDSPARAAGLQKGDLIVSVDGTAVRNSFHLQNLVSAKMGGESLRLVVARPGSGRLEPTVVLANVPAAEREPKKPAEEAGVLPWEEEDKKLPGR